jgi:hypothetical protein
MNNVHDKGETRRAYTARMAALIIIAGMLGVAMASIFPKEAAGAEMMPDDVPALVQVADDTEEDSKPGLWDSLSSKWKSVTTTDEELLARSAALDEREAELDAQEARLDAASEAIDQDGRNLLEQQHGLFEDVMHYHRQLEAADACLKEAKERLDLMHDDFWDEYPPGCDIDTGKCEPPTEVMDP